MKILIVTILLTVLLAGCEGQTETITAGSQEHRVSGRWYSAEQVAQGGKLFQKHCASCHGGKAQGLVSDWRKPQPDGAYPPPPLNGTAHAWHHPLPLLMQTIDRGGIPLGGVMPGFRGKLNDDEKLAVIAWFQNHWPDEVYQRWEQRNGAMK